jgi:OCT family organic cation transporter-like MFS transporter 4/5
MKLFTELSSLGTLVPGDRYINFLVAGIIEFPAYALCLVILYYLGRRGPLSFMFFLSGISLFLMLAMTSPGAVLGMASLGKFGAICAFAIIYVHAAELFPTVLRNTGIGSSSAFARIGSMLAPIIGRELVSS